MKTHDLYLQRKYKAVIDTPPAEILRGIGERAIQQAQYGKSGKNMYHAPPPHAPPHGYYPPPHSYYPPPHGYYPSMSGHRVEGHRVEYHERSSPSTASPPSSPPKRKQFDYPRVVDWTASLDVDEYRGKDNHNYSQFAHIFEGEGLSRLDDLHLVGSADKIQKILLCNLGNANRLWNYITEDIAQITGSGSRSKKHRVKR